MTTKPKTRKAPAAAIDPVFAAISEHKALLRKEIRIRNDFRAARTQAEKKHGKSMEGKALFLAAAEDTKLEYDRWNRAGRAESKAAMRMARTTPSSPAAAAALITHMRREIETGSKEDWEDWVPTALKTVASSLARMDKIGTAGRVVSQFNCGS